VPFFKEIEHFGVTDVGVKRSHNQDAFTVQKAPDRDHWQQVGHLFIVADGMGGHAAGEVASAQAVKSIKQALIEGKAVLETFARLPTVAFREHVAQLMERAIHKARGDIYALAGGALGKRGICRLCTSPTPRDS